MGYIPLRKEIMMCSLFGGIKPDKCEHTCYRIRLRNQDKSVTCNLEALDQTSICDNIASVTPGSWISELNEMKIQLSDVGEESQSVQVLLGSDVIVKLMTGQHRILSCGLVLAWRQYLDGLCQVKYLTNKKPKRSYIKPQWSTSEIDEEQFLVSLSWLDNNLPLPDNFNLVFKGLQVTTHKQKKENLFKEYGDVFKKWK
ncbi:u6 small nuclear RNA-methyltransferase [Trichonephila clavipes]|uniref:U6 small nuclear RNA-methyltransferase n=1 Tax=Trichonephila clavipes TaxID=2585209 RepID=A0A8X6UWC6_TRICX|nr:u6 small nuclear RNA-methyltransferase [Trichonephila clavipes]